MFFSLLMRASSNSNRTTCRPVRWSALSKSSIASEAPEQMGKSRSVALASEESARPRQADPIQGSTRLHTCSRSNPKRDAVPHAMTTIRLFSWGYLGRGNATKQFVECIDLAEKRRRLPASPRSSKRICRQCIPRHPHAHRVTAEPDLGNLAVAKRLRRMKIRRPETVAHLLDLATRDKGDR